MFRSLQSRLLITYLLVVGLVIGLTVTSLAIFLVRSSPADAQTLRRLEGTVSIIAERGGRIIENMDPDRLGTILNRLGLPDPRVLLVSPTGEVLYDSRPGLPRPPESLLVNGSALEEVIQGRYGGMAGGGWLYAAAPLENGRSIWVIAPRPNLLLVLGDELIRPLLQAAAIAVLASLFFAWLISRWVAAPLQRTAEAARAVAAGDYEQQIRPQGPREALSMARSFNHMVEQVRESRQAMRDFVANVSHELKTPLTSIQGFAQAILDGTASGPEERRKAAQIIHQESGRLTALVNDLLELARFDARQVPLNYEWVELNAVLDRAVERLQPRIVDKGVILQRSTSNLRMARADEGRLIQVFTNLLGNGIKAVRQGGTVRIVGELGQEQVYIHFEDDGPGIPQEDLSRIFERFYQVDRSRPGGDERGTGLGLAISREIVEAHGGTINVSSQVGKGSRFTIALPAIGPADDTLPSTP